MEPSFEKTLRQLSNNISQERALYLEREVLLGHLKVDQRQLPPGWEQEFEERVLVTLGEDGAEAFWLSVSLDREVVAMFTGSIP